MHKIILEIIGSDYIMFDPSVPLRVYLIPVAAIVFILFVLGCFVNRKLRRIDMLESLKSVDYQGLSMLKKRNGYFLANNL